MRARLATSTAACSWSRGTPHRGGGTLTACGTHSKRPPPDRGESGLSAEEAVEAIEQTLGLADTVLEGMAEVYESAATGRG
jgi:hypothetical protein